MNVLSEELCNVGVEKKWRELMLRVDISKKGKKLTRRAGKFVRKGSCGKEVDVGERA